MSECTVCQEKCEQKFCPVCSIMMPILTDAQSVLLPTEFEMNEAAADLGLERGHRGEFWSKIDKNRSSDIDWIYDSEELEEHRWISGPPPSWELDEAMKEVIKSRHRLVEVTSSRRKLQRGGILPDGTYLSWADEQFWMDGIPVQIPYLTLEKMLKRKDADSYDWRALIIAMNIASNVVSMDRRPHFGYNPRYNPILSKDIFLHPVIAFLDLNSSSFEENIRHRLSYLTRHTNFLRAWIHPRSLENTEWLRRWKRAYRSDNSVLGNPVICRNFIIKNGRLFLRMRKGTQWKTRRLPANPALIARLLNWALSPMDHPDHMRLRCLQYGLLTPEMFTLDEPNLKGIEFLSGIVRHEKVEIDTEKMRFLVEGVSGIRWSVKPGNGPHRSRFRVRPLALINENIDPLPRSFANHICVVETPQLRSLVLGDALGAIILALLDDIGSQQRIETLRPVLRDAGIIRERSGANRNGVLNRLAERVRRDRLQEIAERQNEADLDEIQRLMQQEEEQRLEVRNQAEEIAIRATVAFPRLWSAILRSQIGTRVRLTQRGNRERIITFSQWDTTMTIRNEIEENLVNQMLTAVGWNRSIVHENAEFNERVFIRTGNGPNDLSRTVERFGEILEPMITIRERMRIMPGPAWANFERRNPGPGQLPPFTNGPLD